MMSPGDVIIQNCVFGTHITKSELTDYKHMLMLQNTGSVHNASYGTFNTVKMLP